MIAPEIWEILAVDSELIVKGELVITSSRRDLKFLLRRYISGVDVSRENSLRGMCQEEPLLRYSRI
jgi:hypothetical protein